MSNSGYKPGQSLGTDNRIRQQVVITDANGDPVTIGGGGATGFSFTPTMTRSSTTGSTSNLAFEVSIGNMGSANATVAGAILKPGEVVTFTIPTVDDNMTAVAYNGTGTDLLITQLLKVV